MPATSVLFNVAWELNTLHSKKKSKAKHLSYQLLILWLEDCRRERWGQVDETVQFAPAQPPQTFLFLYKTKSLGEEQTRENAAQL